MSIRVDTASLIAGAVVVGDPGHGVLAELVPSTGDAGPGYAYSSLEFPADTGKEIRGLITSWPTNGTLVAYEDTSFEYDGTSDTFEWQLYVDGVAVGSPQTVTLSIVTPAEIALAGAAVSLSSASGAITTGISLSGASASVSAASGNLETSITLSSAALAQATESASGSLSTGISMAGNAAALAAAIGVLTAEIRLSGYALCGTSADGSLAAAPEGLAGSAAASASASGVLTTAILMSGNAVCVGGAAGTLNGQIVISDVDRLPVDQYIAAYLNGLARGGSKGDDYLRIGERFARNRGLI